MNHGGTAVLRKDMSGLGRPLTPALSPQAGRRRDPRSGRVRGGTRRATDPARGNTAALILGWVAVAAFLSILPIGAASADKVMRVGMTASDIPTTGGIPTNGGEGFRFLGYPAYDALINWDFKHTDETAGVAPGLATSWEVDEVDRTRWIFHLRKGVKFHDGSDFNADAVAFTLGRIFDDKSPQFDATSSPIVRAVVSMVQRWEKIDDYTVAIYTNVPFSHFPYLPPASSMSVRPRGRKRGATGSSSRKPRPAPAPSRSSR